MTSEKTKDPNEIQVLRFNPTDAYDSLQRVLYAAFDQAVHGKGNKRHAKPNELFENQKICEISRRVGLGFPAGQAIKKIEESFRIRGRQKKLNELYGAINYIAAMCILIEEGGRHER